MFDILATGHKSGPQNPQKNLNVVSHACSLTVGMWRQVESNTNKKNLLSSLVRGPVSKMKVRSAGGSLVALSSGFTDV